ncbi:hypothetical protein SUGI_0896070 [Cryptomeria japonica]|nr:hypothetical protein SUGI_0896070 [Cryptomeria japonica]
MADNGTRGVNDLPKSLCHSSIPHLLGGVWAMVVLVAVAFIILGFSHWRKKALNGQESDGGGNTSAEHGEKNCNNKCS